MALKQLRSLAFLLLLSAVGLGAIPAGAETHPASAAGKAGLTVPARDSGKGDANWDRDLFAIFREGPEVVKSAPVMMEPVAKKVVPIVPKKIVVPRELKLKAIVFSDDEHATALVDGKIVRAGEKVDGWLVRRISRHGLLLGDAEGGREYQLLSGNEKAMVSSCAIVGKE